MEEEFAIRQEEMAFYAKLDEIYSQVNILHAAQEAAYVRLDSLYTSYYTLEDTQENFLER
jgi:hypothetical protein